jgi:hypothetical protein
MEKGGKASLMRNEVSDINHIIKVLNGHIEKFEAAYKKGNHNEFNILKKEIIQLQKKIHSLVK